MQVVPVLLAAGSKRPASDLHGVSALQPPSLEVRSIELAAAAGAADASAQQQPPPPLLLAAALDENRALRAELLALRRLVESATRGERGDEPDDDPEVVEAEFFDADTAHAFEAAVAARASALAAEATAVAANAAAAAAAAAPPQGAATAAAKPGASPLLQCRRIATGALLCVFAAGLVAGIVFAARSSSTACPQEGCERSHYS